MLPTDVLGWKQLIRGELIADEALSAVRAFGRV
jgi:hypothetical protein